MCGSQFSLLCIMRGYVWKSSINISWTNKLNLKQNTRQTSIWSYNNIQKQLSIRENLTNTWYKKSSTNRHFIVTTKTSDKVSIVTVRLAQIKSSQINNVNPEFGTYSSKSNINQTRAQNIENIIKMMQNWNLNLDSSSNRATCYWFHCHCNLNTRVIISFR